MGLTTQLARSIKIASRDKRIFVSRGSIKATPVKSYVEVTDKSYYLLELLDALKDFNQIPDLDKKLGVTLLSKKLKKLNSIETNLLIKYSLAYPPRVRGFLGALLEAGNCTNNLTTLRKSLNPFSEYKYGIADILPNTNNWNIL